jgi:NDP-sugar pyrophosphorylase family protein
MQALILAGGKGTRLRPLTVYTPKPVVPVMNRPFLLYQLDILRKAGINDVILSLNYQPDKIEQMLGDGSEYGVKLMFLTEPTPLGTAGAFRFASEKLRDTTVVLNGDILSNADLNKIIEQHRSTGAEATITLAPVENAANYGLVEADKTNRVKRFIEKPSLDELAKRRKSTINAGIYVFEPSIRDLIPKDENRSLEYHVFPELLERKRDYFAYTLKDEYWRDLGTPESYLEAHLDFLGGRIGGFELEASGGSDIATTASVDMASMIGAGCIIKPNAQIVNSVLGPGVHVEEKAVVENSVVWSHTRISSFAEIRKSVIARSCHIGRNAKIGEDTILGDKASIPDYSRI